MIEPLLALLITISLFSYSDLSACLCFCDIVPIILFSTTTIEPLSALLITISLFSYSDLSACLCFCDIVPIILFSLSARDMISSSSLLRIWFMQSLLTALVVLVLCLNNFSVPWIIYLWDCQIHCVSLMSVLVLVLAWCWEGLGFIACIYCKHICLCSLLTPLFISLIRGVGSNKRWGGIQTDAE